MRIQLAYPWEGHNPDDVVDVDDQQGRTMIREGLARVPDSARDLSMDELRLQARDRGVPTKGLSKAELLEALKDAPPSGVTTVLNSGSEG